MLVVLFSCISVHIPSCVVSATLTDMRLHVIHLLRVNNLDQLKKLRDFADDKGFQEEWRQVKLQKKQQMADYLKKVRAQDGALSKSC